MVTAIGGKPSHHGRLSFAAFSCIIIISVILIIVFFKVLIFASKEADKKPTEQEKEEFWDYINKRSMEKRKNSNQ